MIQLKRGTTWNWTAILKQNGVALDLRNYWIYFTIKKILDNGTTDAEAVVKQYVLVTGGAAVNSKTFTVAPAASRIAPGVYVQGFRYVTPSGGGEFTSDTEFEVLPTATDRNTGTE